MIWCTTVLNLLEWHGLEPTAQAALIGAIETVHQAIAHETRRYAAAAPALELVRSTDWRRRRRGCVTIPGNKWFSFVTCLRLSQNDYKEDIYNRWVWTSNSEIAKATMFRKKASLLEESQLLLDLILYSCVDPENWLIAQNWYSNTNCI